MIFNIPAGGKRMVLCKFLGAVGETLTFTQNGVTVYDGIKEDTEVEIRQGTYTVTGSVSAGHAKKITIKKPGTYNVYPDGAVYWYGREIYPITVGKDGKNGTYSTTANATKNAQSVHLYVKTRGDAGATMRASMYTSSAVNTSGYSEIKIKASLGETAYTWSRTLGYKGSAGVADFGTSAASGVNTIASPGTSVHLGATVKATTYGSVYSISEMTVHAIWLDGGTGEDTDIEETTAGSNSINVDTETYRYTSQNTSNPWQTSNTYSDCNYFGKKTGEDASNNTCLIPIGKFSFTGKSARLRLTAYVYKPSTDFPVFRWAVCTSSANKAMYQGATGVVADDTQIVSGTASLTSVGWHTQSFDFVSTKLPANTDLYVYFWPSGSGGVAHIDGTITAELFYTPS